MTKVVAVGGEEGDEGSSGRRSALIVGGVDLCSVVSKVFFLFFFEFLLL